MAEFLKQHQTALLLLLILLLGVGCRLYRLVPSEIGLLYAQDADEGVYATTAQLALQGYLPYRDFFTPMPPLAIYLFMIVLRIFYHPWGSPTGLMALRYVSVAYGLITVLLTFFTANLIGGRKSGLLAAAIVAVDGIVVAQDRRAMLESLTNLFSLMAIFCYLRALCMPSAEDNWRQSSSFLVLLAGFFCALALLSKGTAIVPPIVIALAILIQRRWREGWRFLVSFLGSYVLCAGFFLITCPTDYIKQMYLFHMLRPWDGTAHPLARVAEIWNYPWSWVTVRFSLTGIAMTFLAGRKVRHRRRWLLVLAWAMLVLLLLLSSRTYWATYFSQLAVPLAILGGFLLNEELDHNLAGPLERLPITSQRLWLLLQIAAFVTLLGVGFPRLLLQFSTTKVALEQIKPAYVEISSYIREHLPADIPILAFETNYTFLSSHPPAGAREGSFFIDSYGEMLYRNLGIPDQPIPVLLGSLAHSTRIGAQQIFHQQPAQREVLAVFSRAPYVVLDKRALKQLAPDTIDYIHSHTRVLESAHAAELRMRLLE